VAREAPLSWAPDVTDPRLCSRLALSSGDATTAPFSVSRNPARSSARSASLAARSAGVKSPSSRSLSTDDMQRADQQQRGARVPAFGGLRKQRLRHVLPKRERKQPRCGYRHEALRVLRERAGRRHRQRNLDTRLETRQI
jgi:hypothetical protein